MKRILGFAMAALLISILMGEAAAESVTIELGAGVKSQTDEALGAVQVLQFDFPEMLKGKRIDTVLLELYVDASLATDAAAGDIPVVDVAPLSSAYSRAEAVSLDVEAVVSRPVRVGENRRVAVDITDLAKGWMSGARANHGLVVGALTGTKAGRFALRDGTLGSGVKARVTIFYQNRFGNRVSSRQ